MKYPQNQFEQLKNAIKEFNNYFEVENINPSSLHYTIYQQGSEGQKHNWFYINNETKAIRRGHAIEDFNNYSKLIQVSKDFELYPKGCNDSHIETAVKAAIKDNNRS